MGLDRQHAIKLAQKFCAKSFKHVHKLVATRRAKENKSLQPSSGAGCLYKLRICNKCDWHTVQDKEHIILDCPSQDFENYALSSSICLALLPRAVHHALHCPSPAARAAALVQEIHALRVALEEPRGSDKRQTKRPELEHTRLAGNKSNMGP
eukprot:1145006-Pelagomonas_calceolata.AAC.1